MEQTHGEGKQQHRQENREKTEHVKPGKRTENITKAVFMKGLYQCCVTLKLQNEC